MRIVRLVSVVVFVLVQAWFFCNWQSHTYMHMISSILAYGVPPQSIHNHSWALRHAGYRAVRKWKFFRLLLLLRNLARNNDWSSAHHCHCWLHLSSGHSPGWKKNVWKGLSGSAPCREAACRAVTRSPAYSIMKLSAKILRVAKTPLPWIVECLTMIGGERLTDGLSKVECFI